VLDLEVLDQPTKAIAALVPIRSKMLALLSKPGSATSLARQLGISRQATNYHLRALLEQGLVKLVEERPRRGLTERVMQATAGSYVVSPQALGASAVTPERMDRLSARYLIAIAARMLSEVADLAARAEQANKLLPTLALDTEIRFATAGDRAQFTKELTATVVSLAARYHNESAPKGRLHRLLLAAHPVPTKEDQDA
jgi:predicted ArsR family transcriptional regulator